MILVALAYGGEVDQTKCEEVAIYEKTIVWSGHFTWVTTTRLVLFCMAGLKYRL